MLTPEDIEAREFLVSLRGFDRAEVREFLGEVAARVRDLEARVAAADAARDAQVAAPSPAPSASVAEPAEPAETPSSIFADIGRETTRILDAAQEAAQGLLRQARTDADRQLQSARHQAARHIAEGEQRRDEIEEIVAGLEAARESLSGNLHEVAVTIDRVLNELGAPPPMASTVREALAAEAASTAEAASVAEAASIAEGAADVDEQSDRPEPAQEARSAREDEAEAGEAREADGPDEPVEGLRNVVEAVEEELEVVEPLEERWGVVEDAETPAARTPESEPLDRASSPDGSGDEGDPGGPGGPGRETPGEHGDGELADVIAMQEDNGLADPQDLRGQALTALHEPLVRAIKRELQEAHNVVLDRLRRTDGQGELESLMPHDEVDRMGVAAAEYLEAAYQAGVHAAAILADDDLDEPTAARDLVADFADDAAARVSSPLAATLRMGRSGDERPPALFDRVGAVFAELKGSVAEELAGGHVIRAYELGLLDAWTAGGITHRKWVLGREPRCPEARCRHNDRAGVVAMGHSYPSGHEVPPIHVGCTCTTIPVSEPPS